MATLMLRTGGHLGYAGFDQIRNLVAVPKIRLTTGDPAPWFVAATSANPQYKLHVAAGRYIALCFFGSAAARPIGAMLAAFSQRPDVFNDDHACFFGVSVDPEDKGQNRICDRTPGFRVFWDFDRRVSQLYGVCAPALDETGGAPGTQQVMYARNTFVLDANLRVIAVLPIDDPAAHARELADLVAGLPAIGESYGPAPVLVLPRVFEPQFCRELIQLYEREGGEDSGFMRDEGGQTVGVIDHSHKRRRDYGIDDDKVRAAIRARVVRRLVPEIAKAFQFEATRLERYIIACYNAGEGGYFRPHRDNTTLGTAHRRFAVTINLNAEDYQGGDLRFPEFGQRTYRAETGGAVVFSCSLLHEATEIKSGRRYCVLPFLYDDAAAELRRRNLQYFADEEKRAGLQAALVPSAPKED